MEDVEGALPPIVLGNASFTVVVHKKRLAWPADAGHEFDPDDDETVASFDVRDAAGDVLFKYDVVDDPRELELARVQREGRFLYSYSAGRYLLEGSPGEALMVDWSFLPSAPGACTTQVILGIVDDELVPFGEPFCETLVTPRDLSASVWRLKKDEQTGADVLEVRRRTPYFSVTIPIRVDFSTGRLLPLQRCLRMNEAAKWVDLCEFPVQAHRRPQTEVTFVRLFSGPDEGRTPRHVVVQPDSAVKFLSALAPNVFDASGNWKPSPADDRPWLKVRVDGKEGWVREDEDLRALGLYAVG
jgi:hypothetical protein